MWTFGLGLGLLALGYAFYGRLIEWAVAPDGRRPTPAIACADGVDFVQMPTWRVYLVQLLNIAGLGPVFGPVMGALWGPQVFLWIVFGAVFGGAVHDFLAGAASMKHRGAGLPELVGHYLGNFPRHLATFFILLLMVLVGTVFVKGPAQLIVKLVPAEVIGGPFGAGTVAWLSSKAGGQPVWQWIVMSVIFGYYVIATVLPIDKIIGRIYPVFAVALLVMVAGLGYALALGGLTLPTMTMVNLHPRALAAWPAIFVTVSCGAVSGFHATQSPMMARCLGTERHMRPVFYGAMIAEGVIALIWSTAAQSYFGGVAGLAKALGPGLNQAATVVYTVCEGTMGSIGGALAILGVVVLPITSGDTAFRVGRLIMADYLKLPQARARNRYLIALPLFVTAFALNFVPFGAIWRYFGWANQTLAAVALWTGAMYLADRGAYFWLGALPATFMTVMTLTFLLVLRFGMAPIVGTSIAIGVGIATLVAALRKRAKISRDAKGTREAERC